MTGSTSAPVESKLMARRLQDFVLDLAAHLAIDLSDGVRKGRLFVRVLQPARGSFCLRSQIADVLTVYHYPAVLELGMACIYTKPEQFIDREIDFLVRGDSWEPIDYRSETLLTKDPLQIGIYAEAWALELAKQDWKEFGELASLESA